VKALVATTAGLPLGVNVPLAVSFQSLGVLQQALTGRRQVRTEVGRTGRLEGQPAGGHQYRFGR
jgi:hypothetical protein